jgi:hypothetical protein
MRRASRKMGAEMPSLEVSESLRKAGLIVATSPLRPVNTATTVRVRDGEIGSQTGGSRSQRRKP